MFAEHAQERRDISSTHPSRPPTEHREPGPPVEWSAKAARDRLSSTVFLAALFHGVVILGVSFSAGDEPEVPAATSLDVVLVAREPEPREAPDDSRVLAEQSLDGAGNTADPDRLQTAIASTAEAAALGPDRPGADQPMQAREVSSDQSILVASLGEESRRNQETGRADPVQMQQRTAIADDSRFIEIVNEPDTRTLISDAGPRELVISASTRESRIAGYLSGWKQQVERVGTLNFPRQASSRDLSGHPTLEVAIRADGSLQEVVVRSSSGQPLIDDAAVEILRIAAPFDPFPEFLRTDYDVLRFAYEWRFGAEPGIARLSATGGS